MSLNLDPILDATVDARAKGFRHAAPPMRLRDIGQQGWNVLRGDLPYPLAIVRRTAMRHNSAWMRAFTQATGVAIAPHGKTTMCPQIFARQLEDGAWGMTVANVHQLGICAALGVRRVVIANQVVARGDVARLVELMRAHADLWVCFLVDSMAQLARVVDAARRSEPARPLAALLEIGHAGGRTGARSFDEAMTLARAIAASGVVHLAGVECYEGLAITGDSERDEHHVATLVETVHAVASTCDRENLFAPGEVILSAGGSAVFDIVARELPQRLSRPVRTLLRSGCYVTHDSGTYERLFERVRARSGEPWRTGEGLQPALEVWSLVQSRPEPGLAILTMGRRDVSYDIEMPRPLKWYREGVHAQPQPTAGEWRIDKLNDQHAYLRVPAEADVEVGDLIGCGISHPCTTFDKWQLLMEVDDDYTVVDALRTFF
ncbi:MAG TPA: amino acid deaminase [Casimicrobiaceae bacterium]|nr:amino acid deaminase [Casimicrobiaceae bacterium]